MDVLGLGVFAAATSKSMPTANSSTPSRAGGSGLWVQVWSTVAPQSLLSRSGGTRGLTLVREYSAMLHRDHIGN